jgi:adenine-specific DNA-methyltransferase
VSFEVHQADANELVTRMEEVDLAYLDPPYNQHPYGSNYFMLNLLVDYRRPDRISRVSGIPTEWNRSRYNQRGEVERALFQLVERCPAKFLLISYNSEGFIPPACFCERLAASGTVTVLETAYNTFRGSRNLRDRPIHVKEFLYLVERR